MRKYVIIMAAVTLVAALTLAGCGSASPRKDLIETPEIDEVSEPATEESGYEADDGASEPPAPTQTAEALPTEPPKSKPPKPAAKPGFDVGNALPDFSVPLAGGGTFTLSENLGKPVFINLFATWCGPCVGEMPEIDRLHNELGDQVSFLIIDIGEDEKTALDFADEYGFSLPFAYSLDGMPFGGDYLVDSIPRTFVLDADGVISAYYLGSRDYDTFKAAIQAALAH